MLLRVKNTGNCGVEYAVITYLEYRHPTCLALHPTTVRSIWFDVKMQNVFPAAQYWVQVYSGCVFAFG